MASLFSAGGLAATPIPRLTGAWDNYEWLVIVGGLACFFMAFGIGANDVANSFATSVGSRTLKLWQAVIVAGIFEFVGAIALGGVTAKTIASDIANTSKFKDVPELYMYGMVCALTIAGVWLLVATYWKLPVSTTHSIIGAIMGFGLVFGGGNGVYWNEKKGDFPYSKGFLPIVLSWFFSPVIGGVLAAIIFNCNRFFVLRSKNSVSRAIWTLPILIFLTFFINLMFVLAKGAKVELSKTWPCKPDTGKWGLAISNCDELNRNAVWIAAATAAGVAFIGGCIGIPLLKRAQNNNALHMDVNGNPVHAEAGKVVTIMDGEGGKRVVTKEDLAAGSNSDSESVDPRLHYPTIPKDAPLLTTVWAYLRWPFAAFYVQMMRGLFYDVHKNVNMDAATAHMHNAAEVFDPATERVYQALQVISACCVSFAHGSNDVANSVGPFSAIYYTYKNHAIPGSSAETDKWIFVLGAFGIVLGLMLYGYHIIVQLGVNMLKLTPSRGFSVELAAGLTISLASFFGIPVSTTQIIVGCEVGCGLCESLKTGISWKVLLKTFLGWIWTIVLALAFCAALFSAGAYAPSILQSDAIRSYRAALIQGTNANIALLNSTNVAFRNDPAWYTGLPATPIALNGSALNAVLNAQKSALAGAVKFGYISTEQALYFFSQSAALLKNNSLVAVGQYNVPAILEAATWNKPTGAG